MIDMILISIRYIDVIGRFFGRNSKVKTALAGVV
jgi:hypothetical protein